MTVLEELEQVQQRMVARLAELEPLVAEYERLKQAVDQLNLVAGPPAKQRPAAAKSRSARPASGAKPAKAKRAKAKAKPVNAKRSRAPKGQRDEEMLAIVKNAPGVKVSEVAQRLGVDSTGLYAVANRLTKQGAVEKRGTQLYPGATSNGNGSPGQRATLAAA